MLTAAHLRHYDRVWRNAERKWVDETKGDDRMRHSERTQLATAINRNSDDG